MDRLYKYYIEQVADYDMLDVLETFSDIYAKLDIDLAILGNIDSYDTPNDVMVILKEGIIDSAIDNNIIPSNWFPNVWFDLDDNFVCIPPENTEYTEEEIEKFIDDFNNWTGLDIEIEWK